jgi:hypothetical protein
MRSASSSSSGDSDISAPLGPNSLRASRASRHLNSDSSRGRCLLSPLGPYSMPDMCA